MGIPLEVSEFQALALSNRVSLLQGEKPSQQAELDLMDLSLYGGSPAAPSEFHHPLSVKWTKEFQAIAAMGPARFSRKGQSGKTINFFPSLKNDRPIFNESVLEADFCLHLECNRDVMAYTSQPHIPEEISNDLDFEYVPDFFVLRRHHCPVYVQVKPHGWEVSEPLVAKMEACRTVFAAHGQFHCVVTDLEIRRKPVYTNIRNLYFASAPNSAAHRQAFDTACHDLKKLRGALVTVGEIKALIDPSLNCVLAQRLLSGGHEVLTKTIINNLSLVDLNATRPFWLTSLNGGSHGY